MYFPIQMISDVSSDPRVEMISNVSSNQIILSLLNVSNSTVKMYLIDIKCIFKSKSQNVSFDPRGEMI